MYIGRCRDYPYISSPSCFFKRVKDRDTVQSRYFRQPVLPQVEARDILNTKCLEVPDASFTHGAQTDHQCVDIIHHLYFIVLNIFIGLPVVIIAADIHPETQDRITCKFFIGGDHIVYEICRIILLIIGDSL